MALATGACRGAGDAHVAPLPSVDFEQAVAHVSLPTSTRAAGAAADSAVRVVIDPSHLLVEGDSYPLADIEGGLGALAQGFDARYKRRGADDLLLAELGASLVWLSHERSSDTAVVIADKATPYRALLEVVYTLGRSGFPAPAIVARGATGQVVVPLAAPSRPAGRGLDVLITNAGLSLRAGQAIAPGCQSVGAGITVPKTPDGHDFAALGKCAESLKHASPAWDATQLVRLSATPATDLQTIVSVLDAVRGPNGELFPEVSLAVTR